MCPPPPALNRVKNADFPTLQNDCEECRGELIASEKDDEIELD